MTEDKHKKALRDMFGTSVLSGLIAGIIMGGLALWVVSELFQPPYPIIMMILMFITCTLYFQRKTFDRLCKKYMSDLQREIRDEESEETDKETR